MTIPETIDEKNLSQINDAELELLKPKTPHTLIGAFLNRKRDPITYDKLLSMHLRNAREMIAAKIRIRTHVPFPRETSLTGDSQGRLAELAIYILRRRPEPVAECAHALLVLSMHLTENDAYHKLRERAIKRVINDAQSPAEIRNEARRLAFIDNIYDDPPWNDHPSHRYYRTAHGKTHRPTRRKAVSRRPARPQAQPQPR